MPESQLQTATLAGGCFWCTEAIFQQLKGVVSVESGYSGGTTEHPTYSEVSSGLTGHAESINIQFDPSVISYRTLLEVFFYLHNPTTLNQQGADMGTEYRSAIFYHNDEQKKEALKVKEEIEKSGLYHEPIVTEIAPFTAFYKAEDRHQNFYNTNRSSPYCSIVIDPKIRKLMQKFSSQVKE